jgi:ABC transporter substrate binding protein
LARPGVNATGFMQFEYSLSGKWLELLKQIAPSVTTKPPPSERAKAATARSISAASRTLTGRTSTPNEGATAWIAANWPGPADMAGSRMTATRLTASALAVTHRELIITLAARHKLPAVYNRRGFVTDGGLIAYGPDTIDLWQRAAAYVDRIFKGENPADLPVQAPTKYELVINLKTAKAMGLTVPPSLLARADEVIE